MSMSDFVLGLDLGNFFSQIGIIVGMNKQTKMGGEYIDLISPMANMPNGIPSAFFYSSRVNNGEPVVGPMALLNVPKENCIRYLKRHLKNRREPFEIDGRIFTCEEMIMAVVRYVVEHANQELKIRHNVTTNKIALAYPASLRYSEVSYLKEQIEKVTLSDGRNIEVVGWIAEPAAASLDYVACGKGEGLNKVIVYDFGAGTFDISLLEIYPEGKTRSDGKTSYYDLRYTEGLEDVGGCECDNAVADIMRNKAGEFANDIRVRNDIERLKEQIKRELTYNETVQPDIILPNGDYIAPVTRDEFEAAVRDIILRTVDMVCDVVGNYQGADAIVLTGGGSQMPVVSKLLKEKLPEYEDKIVFHEPSKAISAGAARYGTEEADWDTKAVTLRTVHDIGILFEDSSTGKEFIRTYIPAGTEVPFTSADIPSQQLNDGRYTLFSVYEANKNNPDTNKPEEDYEIVCKLHYDHGREVKAGYKHTSRMVIDENNMLYAEAWDTDEPEKEHQRIQASIADSLN